MKNDNRVPNTIKAAAEEPKPAKTRKDRDGLCRRRGYWHMSLVVRGKRISRTTGSKIYAEAKRIFSEAKKLNEENRLPGDLARLPFEELCARILEGRRLGLAENSIRLERARSRPLIKHFGRRRAAEIGAPEVREYQTSRAAVVSPRTINLEIRVLRTILKAAKTWAGIAREYEERFGKLMLKEPQSEVGRAIEEAELKLLLDTAQEREEWQPAFYAALVSSNTTARSDELKSLRLRDLDLPNETVSIRKSKTSKGHRNIPLNSAAMWGFVRLVERAAALGSTEPEHFLFPACRFKLTKAGPPMSGTGYDPNGHQQSWRTAWRSLRKEAARRAGADIKDEKERRKAMEPFLRLRFHDLRHYAVTALAETKASDETIMAISGHMSRKMLEHYSHIRSERKRRAVEAINTYQPPEDKPAAKLVQ